MFVITERCDKCVMRYKKASAAIVELPDPVTIVPDASAHLIEVFYEARMARDKYLAMLMDACLDHDLPRREKTYNRPAEKGPFRDRAA